MVRRMLSLPAKVTRILAVGFLAALMACATIPAQQMSDARQAMQAAEAAGAPDRAPADYARAKRLLEQADALLEQGDYAQAEKLAVEAKQAALSAREKALTK